MPFPVELYKGDYYRLAHSFEEHAVLTKDGWSEAKPAGHKYLPISAAGVPQSPTSSPAAKKPTEPASAAPSTPSVLKPPLTPPAKE